MSKNELYQSAIETIYSKVNELICEQETRGLDFASIKQAFQKDCVSRASVTIDDVKHAAQSALAVLYSINPHVISA